MEVGGSSDDSSGNKRKLGAATTGGTGATSATTGPIANGNSSQHVSTSDQGTSQASNSLANPDSTTSTASSGPKAQSSETPPRARFKIGTREGSAQEGSGSKQISDSQPAGVNGCLRTTPLNHEEAEMARGKHSSRSISVSSRSQIQFHTLLSF